ncbi:MAG: LysR family transcriptional regulator [Burkholderiaceae bacterium]|nr:LysR family transcriptional regulator [Burkholderiaceae bacterium]
MESANRIPSILSFVQAAERGSFAAAARAMGISAAAISKNVAGLEQALGVRLMNRTTRSLQLTGEGRAFLEHARIAIDALEQAVDSVAAQRAEPVGRVRITTASAIGNAYLMPLLPALTERYPALSFELEFEDRRVDLIKEGYDLALRGGNFDDSSLVSRRVCGIYTLLVASPEYLARHGVPRTCDDLPRHRTIALRFLHGNQDTWAFKGRSGSIENFAQPAPVLTVSAPEATVDAAVRGIGIAQVGVHHAWHHLREGRLKILLADLHISGEREMALQYPHRALVAPRVRVTVEFLLQKLGEIEALRMPPEALREFAVG